MNINQKESNEIFINDMVTKISHHLNLVDQMDWIEFRLSKNKISITKSTAYRIEIDLLLSLKGRLVKFEFSVFKSQIQIQLVSLRIDKGVGDYFNNVCHTASTKHDPIFKLISYYMELKYFDYLIADKEEYLQYTHKMYGDFL